MNNSTSFLGGLSSISLQDIIVRNPDWKYAKKNCLDHCEFLSQGILKNPNASTIVKECQKNCEETILPPSPPPPKVDNSLSCKKYAQDDDIAYVHCLDKNNLPFDLTQQHVTTTIKTPPTSRTTTTIKKMDFTVQKNRYVFPDSDSMSCAKTIRGRCSEDISLEECIKECDDSEFCNYGYYVKLKPSGKSFCVPLIHAPISSPVDHNLLDATFGPEQFEIASSYDSDFFYRNSLQLEESKNHPWLNYYSPILLEHQGKYLDQELNFVPKDSGTLIYLRPARYREFRVESGNVMTLTFENHKTICLDASGHLTTLPLDIEKQLEPALDRKQLRTEFEIIFNHLDQIQFRSVQNKVSKETDHLFLIEKDGKLSISSIGPTSFQIVQLSLREQLPFEQVYDYYRKFWNQQHTSSIINATQPPTSNSFSNGLLLFWITMLLVLWIVSGVIIQKLLTKLKPPSN